MEWTEVSPGRVIGRHGMRIVRIVRVSGGVAVSYAQERNAGYTEPRRLMMSVEDAKKKVEKEWGV